jgi:hypothetical protein
VFDSIKDSYYPAKYQLGIILYDDLLDKVSNRNESNRKIVKSNNNITLKKGSERKAERRSATVKQHRHISGVSARESIEMGTWRNIYVKPSTDGSKQR